MSDKSPYVWKYHFLWSHQPPPTGHSRACGVLAVDIMLMLLQALLPFTEFRKKGTLPKLKERQLAASNSNQLCYYSLSSSLPLQGKIQALWNVLSTSTKRYTVQTSYTEEVNYLLSFYLMISNSWTSQRN